jgi:hypothetical protein
MVTWDKVTSFFIGVLGSRIAHAGFILLCAGLGGGACGPVSYTVEAGNAERGVAAARAGNAAYYAAYELYFAEAELSKAREEAAQGAYEDAIHLVQVAQAYAKRALDLGSRQGGELRR